MPGSEIVGEEAGDTSSTEGREAGVGIVGIVGIVVFPLELGSVSARILMGIGRSNPTRRTRDTAIVASAMISAARERDLGVVVNTTKYGIEEAREKSAGFGMVICSLSEGV
jgi:hypothetical protein